MATTRRRRPQTAPSQPTSSQAEPSFTALCALIRRCPAFCDRLLDTITIRDTVESLRLSSAERDKRLRAAWDGFDNQTPGLVFLIERLFPSARFRLASGEVVDAENVDFALAARLICDLLHRRGLFTSMPAAPHAAATERNT